MTIVNLKPEQSTEVSFGKIKVSFKANEGVAVQGKDKVTFDINGTMRVNGKTLEQHIVEEAHRRARRMFEDQRARDRLIAHVFPG